MDEEINVYRIACERYDKYVDVYYDHSYMWQKYNIKHYFSDVKQNLQTLVNQRGYLKVD